MRKRQRSRESGWGKFHAIQKMLDAAPETSGQWTLGRDRGLVHSRCNITSRTKTCQEQILGLWIAMGVPNGQWNVPSVRTRPRRINRSGYAVVRRHQERAPNTVNELPTHYTSNLDHLDVCGRNCMPHHPRATPWATTANTISSSCGPLPGFRRENPSPYSTVAASVATPMPRTGFSISLI